MKNFQVRHGQSDSIIFPETFFLESSKWLLEFFLGDNRTLLAGPGIYAQFYHINSCPAVFIYTLV